MQTVAPEERKLLRELAKKQAEYAHLEEMEKRRALWYRQNRCENTTPVIVMEDLTFEKEILPPSRCSTPFARELELTMNRILTSYEKIGDDKVVPDYYPLDLKIDYTPFNGAIRIVHSEQEPGSVGYQYEHLIETLEDDFSKLRHSRYAFDAVQHRERMEMAQDILGDILPVKAKNHILEWNMMLTFNAVKLMGLENFMVELATNPEGVEQLMRFLQKDVEDFLDWMEENSLLTMNNENDYVGSGSYGFTDELSCRGGTVTTQCLWGNFNSQESSSISPDMYTQQIYPFYRDLAKRFGMVYYGCCEPVHAVWEKCLSELPNLRKVSISPWCDEDFMGQALKGKRIVYSRKPSPNFLGVQKEFEEDAFRAHIQKTLTAARDCTVEFIFRDIYTLHGNLEKPARAVEIVRELIRNR